MAHVLNLYTGQYQLFSVEAAQAVINAFEQERKNWNTWQYPQAPDHPRFLEVADGFTCGQWFSPKEGTVEKFPIPAAFYENSQPSVTDYMGQPLQGICHQVGGETLYERQAAFGPEDEGWTVTALMQPGIVQTWNNAGRVLYVNIKGRYFYALMLGRSPLDD